MKLFFAAIMAVFLAGASLVSAGDVNLINKDDLKSMLGSEDLLILDVRANGSWESSDMKIKGAVREDPGEVDNWAGNYPKDNTIVLYCS